jgi:hypothetical protein
VAIYPRATRKLISRNFTPGGNTHRTAVLHTAVDNRGSTSLYGWFNNPAARCSAHFFVKLDGGVEQYVDTNDRAWAAFASNGHGVHIETEDDGNPNAPWNGAQILAICGILLWLNAVHGVAMAACTSPAGGGIGWHEKFAEWNRSNHRCPGPVREAQIRDVIIPAVSRNTGTPPPVVPPVLPPAGTADLSFLALVDKAAQAHPVIKLGSSGQPVKEMQQLLTASIGAPVIAVDGVFGENTQRWVKQYQKDRRVVADGVVARSTWAWLIAEALNRVK